MIFINFSFLWWDKVCLSINAAAFSVALAKAWTSKTEMIWKNVHLHLVVSLGQAINLLLLFGLRCIIQNSINRWKSGRFCCLRRLSGEGNLRGHHREANFWKLLVEKYMQGAFTIHSCGCWVFNLRAGFRYQASFFSWHKVWIWWRQRIRLYLQKNQEFGQWFIGSVLWIIGDLD